MIPKTIHYCWYGEAEYSDTIKKCIQSWKTHLPDYAFKRWDETNSPLDVPFAKQAYAAKKWAFVADYVRFYALYHEGGIYLDTDMLLLKNLDSLLECNCFLGCETQTLVNTAIIGAIKKHWFVEIMKAYYEREEFDPENLIPITRICTDILGIHGFDNAESIQTLKDIRIYPPKYFYPYPFPPPSNDFRLFIRKESFSVHLWEGSWLDTKVKSDSLESYWRSDVSFIKSKFKRFAKDPLHKVLKSFIRIKFIRNYLLQQSILPFHIRYFHATNIIDATVKKIKRNELNFLVTLNEHNGQRIYFNLFTDSTLKLFNSIDKKDVIIDVGANMGYYTLNFAKRTPLGKVIAFEPHPPNYEILLYNLSINSYQNIDTHPIALGNINRDLNLEILNKYNNGMVRVKKTTEVVKNKIPCMSLDKFLHDTKIPEPINLIKIDIEGFEMNFLKGAINTLLNHKPKLFIELCDKHLHHFGSSAKEVVLFLTNLGYKIINADTGERVLPDSYLINCFMDIFCEYGD